MPFCPQRKLGGIPNKGLRGGSNVKLPFLRICLQAMPSVQYFLKLVFLCLDTSASYLIASCLPASSPISSYLFVHKHSQWIPLHTVKTMGQPHLNAKPTPAPGTLWGKVPWRPIGLNLYKVKYGKYAVGSRIISK